jgi:anti-sigma factor RsiW
MNDQQAPIGEDDLQAFVDDRLDGPRRALVEAYLRDHREIAERIAAERRQRTALREQLQAKFAEPIPARLRISSIQAARRGRWRERTRTAAAALVIFVAGAGSGWFSHPGPAAGPGQPTTVITQDATAAYRTFVMEVAHPVEVRASDEAHLLQWLSKRLGRPLTAPDLSAHGYRLMGGRLLPGGSGAAAQLMYDDASGNRLTLYVEAVQEGETAFRFAQMGDAATFAWIDQGLGFAVTSRVQRESLLPIAEAIYQQFGSAGEAGLRRG